MKKNLILIALLSFLLTAIAWPQVSARETWPYDQFMQAVEQNQVEKVIFTNDRTQALVITKTGETVNVNLPNDPTLIQKLDQANIDISVAPAMDSGNVLSRILSTLLIPGVILLLMQGFWLWMLIDCAIQEAPEGNTKIVWIIIILLINFVGALIYFWVRRPQRLRELGH